MTAWTPERVKLLARLWWAGESPLAIAGKIGGVTKKAVEQKASVLKLPRENRVERHRKYVPRTSPSLKKAPQSTTFAPLHDEPSPLLDKAGAPVTMTTVGKKQCRWIPGEPVFDAQVCGHQTDGGRYCAFHRRRAYQPVTESE